MNTIDAMMKTCPVCNRKFRCGYSEGQDACWCANYPNIMPLKEENRAEGCLCPECLDHRIKERMEANSDERPANDPAKHS